MNRSENRFDFGYSWFWQWGHGVLGLIFLVFACVLFTFQAPGWTVVLTGAGSLWGLTGLILMQFVFRAHKPLVLPTDQFIASGEGRLLDLGCGSGRTSIMMGQARPAVKIVGVDNFSANYISNHGQERLLRNLRIAGVADRFEIREGDMRRLPFPDASFDAAMSSYALDHLGKDIPTALSEVRRVLKPGGEMLLMVIMPNAFNGLAFLGMVCLAFLSPTKWTKLFQEIGFTVAASGRNASGGWYHLIRK